MHDVIRILRIKQLSSLGIPLKKMIEIFDSENYQTGEALDLLDLLDEEIEIQILRLERQREHISLLRSCSTTGDPSSALSSLFSKELVPIDFSHSHRIERDLLVLLTSVLSPNALYSISDFHNRLFESRNLKKLHEIAGQFSSINAQSTQAQKSELVEDLVEELRTSIGKFFKFSPVTDTDELNRLFDEYTYELLNKDQQEVLEQIGTKLNCLNGLNS